MPWIKKTTAPSTVEIVRPRMLQNGLATQHDLVSWFRSALFSFTFGMLMVKIVTHLWSRRDQLWMMFIALGGAVLVFWAVRHAISTRRDRSESETESG